MKTYHPKDDRVLVRVDTPEAERKVEREDGSVAKIIMPRSTQDMPETGTIVGVGNGTRHPTSPHVRIELDFSEGQRVLFSRYAGSIVKIDGVEHRVLREAEVLCVIEETAEQKAA